MHVVSIQEVLAVAAAVGIKAGHVGLRLGCRAKLTCLLHLGLGVLGAGRGVSLDERPLLVSVLLACVRRAPASPLPAPGPTAPSCRRCRDQMWSPTSTWPGCAGLQIWAVLSGFGARDNSGG